MLVKCSWCKQTFNSERYGRQFCPHCGAELDLPLPEREAVPEARTVQPGEGASEEPLAAGPEVAAGTGAGAAPGEEGAEVFDPWAQPGEPGAHPPAGQQPPPAGAPWGGAQQQWGGAQGGGQLPPGGPQGGGAPPWGGGQLPPGGGWGGDEGPPQDEDAPWERRGALGLWPALVETWKQATLDPKRFYARLKTYDIAEAFLYGWIFSTLGTFLGSIWGVSFNTLAGGDVAIAWGQVVFSPILSALGLFLGAGIIHLGCLIFGCATRGFDATFRTVAYAQGPAICHIVPVVGGLVATVWTAVITIQGIAAMQRTTTGKATGAVLLPGLIVGLCCGCLILLVFAGIFSAVGGMGQTF